MDRASDVTEPSTVDAYLARLPPDQRAALEKLRAAIKSAAPKAVECISYKIPSYRLDGRLLVHFGAAANHCAFYPGGLPLRMLEAELADYSTSKGTIRFTPDRPLPVALVRKIVKLRIEQNAAKRAARTAR